MHSEKTQFMVLVTTGVIATAMVMFGLLARALAHTKLFLRYWTDPMEPAFAHRPPGAAPYPNELTRRVRLTDGRVVTLRPIRPEDGTIEREFVKNLSPRSKYERFMFTFRELPSKVLLRFTQIDYRREMALIAVLDTPQGERQVGVARYATLPDGRTCEFAIVVADDCQGRGLAPELMQSLIGAARDRGLQFMTGMCLRENVRMQRFARAFGFVSTRDPDDPHLVRLRLVLPRTVDGACLNPVPQPAAELA